jgi:hypothetical protein
LSKIFLIANVWRNEISKGRNEKNVGEMKSSKDEMKLELAETGRMLGVSVA